MHKNRPPVLTKPAILGKKGSRIPSHKDPAFLARDPSPAVDDMRSVSPKSHFGEGSTARDPL